MDDWFSQNAPKAPAAPAPSGDWFAQHAPEAPAATSANASPSTFAEEFWKRANPLSWAEGLANLAKGSNALDLIKADPKFLADAKDAYDKGDLLTAARKVLSFTAMGLGHDLDAQADMGAQGNYAGMAGAMAGTGVSMLAPEAALRGVAAVAPKAAALTRMQPANPAIADAVKFGQASGVPVDAASATDNAAIRAVQHISDRSLGGAQVAGRAAEAQRTGLATLGEQLAAKAHPTPVTPEMAGQGINASLEDTIRSLDTKADTAYARLRQIADQNRQTVQTRGPVPAPEDAPSSFTDTPSRKGGPLPDAVFDKAYADAVTNGYTGTKAALRDKFDTQLKSGYDGLADRAAANDEYGPMALLRSVRDLGGLRGFDREIGSGRMLDGDLAALRENFRSKAWGQSARGVVRSDGKGLALDDLTLQLQQDPRWAGMDSDTLKNALDEISRNGPPRVGPKPNAEDALALTDARPGAQWWINRAHEDQAIPVDLRGVREQLQPIYQRLQQERELAPMTIMGDKARAFTAIDTLMKAKDSAPLEVVDRALSDIKALARGSGDVMPELRSQGQGVAAKAVQVLDDAVQQAAASAGPDAVSALQEGRAATRAKYAVGKVYDAIRDEPVQAFNRAVAPRDTSIAQLRDVAQFVPQELPKIGRAYLDSLLDKAESGAAGADRLFSDWQKLGPETKQMLFQWGGPGYIKDLDNFFVLAKQMAKNANPSGTAHAVAVAAQGGELLRGLVRMDPTEVMTAAGSVLGTTGLSAFLHSPTGVRLLTQGITLPPSAAARAAWLSRVRAFGAAQTAAAASARPVAVPQGSTP